MGPTGPVGEPGIGIIGPKVTQTHTIIVSNILHDTVHYVTLLIRLIFHTLMKRMLLDMLIPSCMLFFSLQEMCNIPNLQWSMYWFSHCVCPSNHLYCPHVAFSG